ncbi:MAG: hypothetical protein QOJ39_3814 [Candidatus Eremiobacteraeota bacterium]|jgi:hypothetical protein|nr:hypothetical protein [Candidatus Eremiobacteraeota bacterium]
MRRTPLWVFVAAVGVQLAALGLCLWVMERGRRTEIGDGEPQAAPESQAAAQAEALPPAPPLSDLEVALARNHAAPAGHRAPEPVPVREPEPVQALPPEPAFGVETEIVIDAPHVHEPPRARGGEPQPRPYPAPRRVVIRSVQPPPAPNAAAPLFGPPPDRPPEPPPDPDAIPRYITESAEATTQIVRGTTAEGPFAFGFYPDGNIRFVDVDGGRYAGKAESARARLREDGGTRAFTVQIGVAADGRLQATFTGGPHDARTFPLEPLAGWSVA